MGDVGWLFGIIIVLVIAAAAYAGSGKLGSMPQQVVDRPGPDLPAGELSAADLDEVRFDVVTRGYDPQQVEALLDRLSAQLGGAQLTDEHVNDASSANHRANAPSLAQDVAAADELLANPMMDAAPAMVDPVQDTELSVPQEADEVDDPQPESDTEILLNQPARRAE